MDNLHNMEKNYFKFESKENIDKENYFDVFKIYICRNISFKSHYVFISYIIIIIFIFQIYFDLYDGNTNIFLDIDQNSYFSSKFNLIIAKKLQLYRLITCGFLHSNFLHISNNILGLLIFGSFYDNYSNFKFFSFIMMCLVLSNIVELQFLGKSEILVGASGIVYSLIGGISSYYIKNFDLIKKFFKNIFFYIGAIIILSVLFISSLGHLLGFFFGNLVGYLFHKLDPSIINNGFTLSSLDLEYKINRYIVLVLLVIFISFSFLIIY